MSFRYDVFLSYRHMPLDTAVTKKVFSWLEGYKLPASVRGQGKREIKRVFRDQEELPLSGVLTETIDEALSSSEILIVICSADTPSSRWVDREIEMFSELGRQDHIYPLLINGDFETSFPPSLKKIPGIEERVMDIRKESSREKDILTSPRTPLLKAVADLTDTDETVLRREESFRKNRKTALIASVAAAALIITGTVSFLLMSLAGKYRDKARLQEQATMRILSELTYDLPDRLADVPGAYSRIAGILEENADTIDKVIMLSRDGTKARFEAASNRERLANAKSVMGMYKEALETQDIAVAAYEELAEDKDDAHVLAYGSSLNNRGNIFHAAGRYEEAWSDYEKSLLILHGMEDTDHMMLARIYGNLAANAVSTGDDSADGYFDKALSVLDEVKDEVWSIFETASVLYNRGTWLYRQGRYEEASIDLERSAGLYESIVKETGRLTDRVPYLNSLSVLAACLSDSGRYEEAERFFAASEREAEWLAKDSENLKNQVILAEILNNHGLCLNSQERYKEADGLYRRASGIYKTIYETSGSVSSGTTYAVSLLNTGENAFKAGDYKETDGIFKEGLGIFETLLDELDDYDLAQYYTWLSYHRLINEHDPEGALEASVRALGLQSGSVLANMNYGYACLYSGHYEECDRVLTAVADLGEGQATMIMRDLEAQEKAGLFSSHTEVLKGIIIR